MTTTTIDMPATTGGCPHNSIDMLNRHMRACVYPKADIIVLAKRLQDCETAAPMPAALDDVAGLKVEKNALALVFIPAVMSLTEEFVAAHPGVFFNMLLGQVGTVDLARVRAVIDPRNPQAAICGQVYASLRAAFQHIARAYVQAAQAAAEGGDEHARWLVDTLLTRYARALADYHTHTSVSATHFTPSGHILAGVNTALFFILRALSAVMVLGEDALGRPVTRDDLAAAMRNTTPLLLTIARCHLELLLELEEPLGTGTDLFLTRMDAAGYAAALGRMFVVVNSPEGLRLEVAEDVLAGLPVLSGSKPRTGCPALYASTLDNVNVIVALIRMTESAFADLLFGP